MKRNYIFKEAGILLVVATLILTTVAAAANTQTTVKVKDPIIESFDTFTEGFEGGVVPPTDWLNIDHDGDGFLWKIIEPPGFPPHSGDYSAGSESWDAVQQVPLTPDNWLITPPMIASDITELSYWVAAQDPDWAQEHIEVWISTTGTTVPDDFTDQVDDYTCPAGSSDWFERVIDLSSYDGENIYIAFRHCDCTDWFWIKIDDVTVTNVEFGAPLVADADGPYEGEVGEDIQFTGGATGGVPPYTYEWDFGNGDTSVEQNPVYAYAERGIYDVTLTVTDSAKDQATDDTTATIIGPEFEIGTITGGKGVAVAIKNVGDGNATNVKWDITIDGGFIIIPRTDSGELGTLAPDQSANVTFGPMGIGLGIITAMPKITVTVTCDEGPSAEESAEARIILFFVIIQ